MRSEVFMSLCKPDNDSPMQVTLARDVGEAFVLPVNQSMGLYFERYEKSRLGDITGCTGRGFDNVELGVPYKCKGISHLTGNEKFFIRPDNFLIDAERNPSRRLQIQRTIYQREIGRLLSAKDKEGFWKRLVISVCLLELLCIVCLLIFLLA